MIIAGEFPDAAEATAMPSPVEGIRAYSDGSFVPVADMPEGAHRALALGAGSVCAAGGRPVDIVTLCDPGAQLRKNWNPAHKKRLLAKSRRLLLGLLQSDEYRLAGMLWLGQAHSQADTEAYQVMFSTLIDRLRIAVGALQLPVSAMVQGDGDGDYTKGVKLSNYVRATRSRKKSPTLADHTAALAKGLDKARTDSPWASDHALRWLWKGEMYEAWQSRPAGAESDHYIVVFPHAMSGNDGFDIPAFGQEAFEKRRAQAVFIRTRQSNWFQDGEVLDLGAAIRATLPEGARITAYGASMGAYGALLLSGILRAERVVAVAPQFSLDHTVAPFERRWREHRNRIGTFRHDLAAMISAEARKHLFYDPLDTDRRHIALMQPDESFRLHRFPAASHQILRYLVETGTIGDFLSSLIDPDADFDKMDQTARGNRQQSPIYWLSVFRRFKATRPHCAAAALERCIAIEGPRPKYTKRLNRLDPDGAIREGASPVVDA